MVGYAFVFTNGPITFMRFMNEVLMPYQGKLFGVYLDDILCFSKRERGTLQEYNGEINKRECTFMLGGISVSWICHFQEIF